MSTRKQYLKCSFRLTFKSEKNCNEATVIRKEKCRINLNKPIYIGTIILDLCKVLMQEFQCN